MIHLPLLVALSLTFAPETCGCTCLGPGPLDKAVAGAAAVFVGRVAEIDWEERGLKARVRLRVDRAWKWPGAGTRPPRELVVETAQGPACGAYFSEGEEWLVFAYPAEDRRTLRTGQCTGTDQIDLRGDEPWQRQARAGVRERLRWLDRQFGEGSRSAP